MIPALGAAVPASGIAGAASGVANLAPARADNGGLTPAHVARIRSVGAAVISPNGRTIAYTLSVPRRPFAEDSGPAWSELHVVNPTGRSRPFVTGPVNVGHVAWVPDGSGISFTAKRGDDEHATLYVIPIDGGEARKVIEHETDVGDYAWNPDGTEVAFLAADPKPKTVTDLEDDGFNAEVYEEDRRMTRVWIGAVRLDASPGEAVDTDADADAPSARKLELTGHASRVVWSPDGRRLAVALAPTSLVDDGYMKRRIHIIDAETGSEIGRVQTSGKLGTFRFSPDGTRLGLIGAEDIHDPAPGRMMVVDASGGKPTDLLPGYLGHVTAFAWQDGRTIMFLGDEGVWTTLAKVTVDASVRKTLIPPAGHVLRGLTLTRDGTAAAMVGDGATHPAEVFTMRHGDPAPRRLTDSNPWLDDIRLARQEPVQYQARDGLVIGGVLVHPLDEQAGKRYPLIVSVHGGPESHESCGWKTTYSRPGQVAAARGFAVFYPNYRGSTGRGVAFSKLDQGDQGGPEFDDIVDGVDALIARGLVDADRVGVTGGSYGGYATAWCATYYSDRFAAAVMFVGISDHTSKFGTTDIPNEMHLVHARKWPWEDWDLFRQRSPLMHVQNARTPILILHGKDDPRVHPSQSLMLYRYLKTLGTVPVRLVWYPGEGHGNRKSAARLDYNVRMMRWMEHYLKGDGGAPPDRAIDYGPYRPEPTPSDDDEADTTP